MTSMKLKFIDEDDINNDSTSDNYTHHALTNAALPFLLFILMIKDIWCMQDDFTMVTAYKSTSTLCSNQVQTNSSIASPEHSKEQTFCSQLDLPSDSDNEENQGHPLTKKARRGANSAREDDDRTNIVRLGKSQSYVPGFSPSPLSFTGLLTDSLQAFNTSSVSTSLDSGT